MDHNLSDRNTGTMAHRDEKTSSVELFLKELESIDNRMRPLCSGPPSKDEPLFHHKLESYKGEVEPAHEPFSPARPALGSNLGVFESSQHCNENRFEDQAQQHRVGAIAPDFEHYRSTRPALGSNVGTFESNEHGKENIFEQHHRAAAIASKFEHFSSVRHAHGSNAAELIHSTGSVAKIEPVDSNLPSLTILE